MAAEPVCDIIVPIWNLREMTARCLESVRHHTGLPVRLILIDNGSDVPTQELLKRFQSESGLTVEILRNEQNLGFIRAVNQGIRTTRAPWICLLNNDTVVTSGWLDRMLRVAKSDPTIGLVNPTSNCMGYQAAGASPETIAQRLAVEEGRSAPLTVAVGFCLLAPRALFDRIGLLDEQFGMGNFDDDDLTRRARQAGFRPVRALAAYVHHEGKASFKKLSGWKRDFDENRRKFEKKWGRKLRILWGPENPGTGLLEEIASAGHWISVIGAPEKNVSLKTAPAQVNYLGIPGRGWRSRATWRLLIKRKKPFDLVISTDSTWSQWVRRLRPLHQARLLQNPTKKELLEQCRILSRSRS